MTAMAKKSMKEANKIMKIRLKKFVDNYYTPVEGSEKTLNDVKDVELVFISMDDPDFRKEYGVSDKDYKKWNNYMSASVNVNQLK